MALYHVSLVHTGRKPSVSAKLRSKTRFARVVNKLEKEVTENGLD